MMVRPIIFMAVLVLAGCQSTYYDWGHYEESVYVVTSGEEAVELDEEIRLITEDIEGALEAGRPIPPGMYAHLAFLHYLAGEDDLAMQHFTAERALYPESAVFIDRLLSRMEQ